MVSLDSSIAPIAIATTVNTDYGSTSSEFEAARASTTALVKPVPPPKTGAAGPPPPPPPPPVPKPNPPASTSLSLGFLSSDPTSSPSTNGVLASTLISVPSGTSTGVPTDLSEHNDGSLSIGATAGIGIGIALAVILMAVGVWAFMRRRRRRRWLERRRSTSDWSYIGESPDMEVTRRITSGRPRGLSELASPLPEVHGDREFPVELEGSMVPDGDFEKDDGLFVITEPQPAVVRSEKKSGVRLFDDPPIDERDENLHCETWLEDKKDKM